MEVCNPKPSNPTPINLLILEYFKDSDIDGDGRIYGIDFIIDGDDAPEVLQDINDDNGLIDKIPIITWRKYITTIREYKPNFNPDEWADGPDSGLWDGWEDDILIPPSERDDRSPCQILPPFTRKQLTDDLIEEFNTATDVNGDGLIYGKDFYIIGDTKPIEIANRVPLYAPRVMVSWVAYCKSQEYDKTPNVEQYAALLLAEYNTNEDLDGNGLIYGVDFSISDCDEFSDLDIPNVSPIMTTSEYAITIVPYIEDYIIAENILATKFNTEYLDDVDVDGNGLIYGKDFILTDYENNKSECLWTHENYQNMELSWTSDKLIKLKSLIYIGVRMTLMMIFL